MAHVAMTCQYLARRRLPCSTLQDSIQPVNRGLLNRLVLLASCFVRGFLSSHVSAASTLH